MIALAELAALARGRRVVALTGAGISTESGIPDYRGPGSRQRVREPMQHREFVGSEAARRVYWARSFRGWPLIAAARPNRGHRALARLESAGALAGVITQNVDGLHAAAGSRRVIELHGALAGVICLGCGAREQRATLQRRLAALNPARAALDAAATGPARPDGDVEPDVAGRSGQSDGFQIAGCLECGGVLKPDVVFFGGSIPAAWSEAAWQLYAEAELLLVVGSSLAVFSGFRFVRRAAADGVPVAILNIGETRGDDLAALRIDAAAGDALEALTAIMSPAGAPRP